MLQQLEILFGSIFKNSYFYFLGWNFSYIWHTFHYLSCLTWTMSASVFQNFVLMLILLCSICVHPDWFFWASPKYFLQLRCFKNLFSLLKQANAGQGRLVIEVSRSHTRRQQGRQDSFGRGIGPLLRFLPDNIQHLQETDIHAPVGFEPAVLTS
jgi:hypothetical protein